MIDPVILRAMQAAGCSTDQILAVVEADAAIEEDRKARKRAGNAERQRRYKAKQGNAGNASATPSDVINGHGSLKEKSPTPPKEIHPPEPPVISSEMTPPAVEIEPEPEELRVEHVMEAYNQLATRLGLPIAEKLTKTRRRQAEARIRENPLENWHRALDAIERSAFLRGENDRGWRADFDFLLQPKSFAKLIEGAYDH